MDLERIYETAEKHFFAKEYSDVKLDNIANELGIKKPSLYYYFINKRDFFVKTLKYSMKKYVEKLRESIVTGNLSAFLHRYLFYPSQQKNLFAIAAYKGYPGDKEIQSLILNAKDVIKKDTHAFLKSYDLTPIRIYLICNLLDKLAMENCIEGYCLEYSIENLTKEIEAMVIHHHK